MDGTYYSNDYIGVMGRECYKGALFTINTTRPILCSFCPEGSTIAWNFAFSSSAHYGNNGVQNCYYGKLQNYRIARIKSPAGKLQFNEQLFQACGPSGAWADAAAMAANTTSFSWYVSFDFATTPENYMSNPAYNKEQDGAKGRHGGKNAGLFVDGHVESIPVKTISRHFFNPGNAVPDAENMFKPLQ